MTVHHYAPPTSHPARNLNWSMIGFLFGAAVTIAGWIVFGAQSAQRIEVLEERTTPLADGDLVRVQTDVAWIRQRLEREAAR